MTEDDIVKARRVIAGATSGRKIWGFFRDTTYEGQIAQFAETLRLGPPGEVNCVCVAVDDKTPIEQEALYVAITGNGPTSEANARYIVGSFDQVAGWGAALDEAARMRTRVRDLEDALARAVDMVEFDAKNHDTGTAPQFVEDLRTVLGRGRP